MRTYLMCDNDSCCCTFIQGEDFGVVGSECGNCGDGRLVEVVKKAQANPMKEMVAEFHRAFGVPVNDVPQYAISGDRMLLRARLIFEEAEETIEAMNCLFANLDGGQIVSRSKGDFNLCQICDGLADLLYVTFGACLEFGIPIEKVFAEVHRSNMSKMWTRSERRYHYDPPLEFSFIGKSKEGPDDERCYTAKRADGKIIKSPSYSPADIQSCLRE